MLYFSVCGVVVCGLSGWGVLFCLVHCFSSSLPSCMDLSFAEIVNQLNALSCLHGDDDDDDGGGVPKRARKATAKPAASSQGLFFTFLPPSSFRDSPAIVLLTLCCLFLSQFLSVHILKVFLRFCSLTLSLFLSFFAPPPPNSLSFLTLVL